MGKAVPLTIELFMCYLHKRIALSAPQKRIRFIVECGRDGFKDQYDPFTKLKGYPSWRLSKIFWKGELIVLWVQSHVVQSYMTEDVKNTKGQHKAEHPSMLGLYYLGISWILLHGEQLQSWCAPSKFIMAFANNSMVLCSRFVQTLCLLVL